MHNIEKERSRSKEYSQTIGLLCEVCLMIRKTFLLILGSYLFLHGVAASATMTPTEQVRGTVDSILDTLRHEGLDRQTRKNKIHDLLHERFYFRAMSQRTLATNWRKASAEEKASFVKLFSKLLENTYMGKIEAYTDERIEYVNEKIKGKKAIVDTQIITKNTNIPISYKTILKDNEWLIYDVVVEEVSLISNYRSSYKAIVKKEGISGLLSRMEQKIKDQGSAKE